ncbi:MAG: hypothetical protein FD177_575 [Desulfovibrionaceae bacterium]|nr:MAG: hypothetical protein FD177_575 [Desulfovibrionaceae bacterium]
MERVHGRVWRVRGRISVLVLMLLCVCFALGACSTKPYAVGHAKRALDPDGFPQSVSGKSWIIAAVRTGEGAGGVDYSSTRLLPVLLVLKNTGQSQPQVILEDVRGVATGTPGADGAEYLVYTPEEGVRLATAKPFTKKAASAASSGTWGAGIGAALGAGAGALVYLLGGSKDANLIWQASAVGGGAGAVMGVATSNGAMSKQAVDAVRADLEGNVWKEDPITPGTTRMGYLLLPESLGIRSVRMTVRDESGSETHTLPIAQASEYSPELARAKASQTASNESTGPTVPKAPSAPIKGAEQELPEPKRVLPPLEI